MWSIIWNGLIVNPMTNLLLLLYDVLGNNFFLALIVFTALIRLAMLPLTMKQQRSMMKTQEMQPQVQAIQKKYKDDQAKMMEEFQKIGYNPAESLTGCLPLLIQMPIFFGLYRAILYVLSSTPQGLYELSERAYDFINLTDLLPVSNRALWLNLGQPDPIFILPVLVAATMYASQKLVAPKKDSTKTGEDNPAAAMQQQMQVTMPLMFGFFALQFPSGLSIYFIVSNLITTLQGIILRRNKESLKAEQAINNKGKSTQPASNKGQKDSTGARKTTKNTTTEKNRTNNKKGSQSRKKRKRG